MWWAACAMLYVRENDPRVAVRATNCDDAGNGYWNMGRSEWCCLACAQQASNLVQRDSRCVQGELIRKDQRAMDESAECISCRGSAGDQEQLATALCELNSEVEDRLGR